MQNAIHSFELRRQIDNLVYTFERKQERQGHVGYKRTDGNYWIVKHPRLGWIAGNINSDEVFGRPWEVLASDQGENPPEGIWVSRKGIRSYVYDLVYV